MEEEAANEEEKGVEQEEVTAEEYLDVKQDEFLREVFSYAVSDEFEEDEENNLAEVEERHGDEKEKFDQHFNQLDGALDSSDDISDVSDDGSDVSWDPVSEARKRRGKWEQRNDSESSNYSESSLENEESPMKVPPKKFKPSFKEGEGHGGEEQEDEGEGVGDGQAEVEITPPPSEDEEGEENTNTMMDQQKDDSKTDEGNDTAEFINLEEVVTTGHVEDDAKEPEEHIHVQQPLKANTSKAKWRTLDKKGREILEIPANGSFYQFIAPNETNPSTIASHMEHLSIVRLLENKKTGAVRIEFHIVDQGAGTVR